MAKLNARVSHLHATAEIWNTKTEFIPNAGELIVYDKDASNPHTRFKFGDGESLLKDLPFFTTESISDVIDGGDISEYPTINDIPEEPEEEVDE